MSSNRNVWTCTLKCEATEFCRLSTASTSRSRSLVSYNWRISHLRTGTTSSAHGWQLSRLSLSFAIPLVLPSWSGCIGTNLMIRSSEKSMKESSMSTRRISSQPPHLKPSSAWENCSWLWAWCIKQLILTSKLCASASLSVSTTFCWLFWSRIRNPGLMSTLGRQRWCLWLRWFSFGFWVSTNRTLRRTCLKCLGGWSPTALPLAGCVWSKSSWRNSRKSACTESDQNPRRKKPE